MKPLAVLSLALMASPALAHPGLHLHPHADSAAWWPVLAGSLVVGTAGLIAWVKR